MDYVNPPVGGGKKPPSPLKPHLAIPTTSGTGAEATTVAVLDIPEEHVKSGISHRYLRPSQGIVDPELVRSLPAEVTSSTGLDVICHAAESFLTRPYDRRERPETPDDRPPYQGANPVADVWSAKALEYGGRYLRRAVADSDDLEARGMMMLAASMAGVGFGSAGVHIPHACAYPIASLKHEYQPPGYPDDHKFVPHGHSVIVTAPAAFRFTYEAMPDRHHQVAEWLAGEPIADPGPDTLPDVLRTLMQRHRLPARDRRAGLHGGRRAGAGGGDDEAAAAARRDAARGGRDRHRPHPQRIDDQLVEGEQMADDIRLYMFDGGTLKCHVENIKMNQGLGEPVRDPGRRGTS